MRHNFSLSLFLLPFITIKPMLIVDDVIINHIGPRLNRVERSAIKATCRILHAHIPSQNTLNKQYDLACLKDDKPQIKELRDKGALPTHEEVYNLFKKKNYTLAQKIWFKNKFNDIPCDVTSAYLYGVQRNNTKFTSWLLQKLNPPHDGYVITKSLELAKVLQRNAIMQILTSYAAQDKEVQLKYLFSIPVTFSPNNQ